jgi:hypothetical protein
VGTVDNIIIYEIAGMPSLSTIQINTMGKPRSNFSFVSYDNPTLPPAFVIYKYTPYVQYLYVTSDNGTDGNPWDTIPSYLENLVDALHKLSFLTVPPFPEDDTRGRI